MTIEVGSVVIVHLGMPREQVFGLVLSLQQSGIVVRGMTLSSVDDWLRDISGVDGAMGASMGLTTTFYPMHRVEKVILDEPSFGAPGIEDRFRQRTGMKLADFIGREKGG